MKDQNTYFSSSLCMFLTGWRTISGYSVFSFEIKNPVCKYWNSQTILKQTKM